MKYFAVLYNLDGLIAKKSGKGLNSFHFKEIGDFKGEDDVIMIASSMLRSTSVVKRFMFHVERERWCLYNENEFNRLLIELKICIKVHK